MRVVNKKIIAALKAGEACNASSNTRVDEQGNVYLFDRHIARRRTPRVDLFDFNLCGWPTVTTVDRLNALVDAFGGTKVRLSKGAAYRGDKVWTAPVPHGVDKRAHAALHGTVWEDIPSSGWFPAQSTVVGG